ncbi:TonB-dependent receptor [Spirosoma endophyticum]|uniref:TonB-linked outer membrane protein, SusC/RagA family n=1 Tax=Spirosoma endophyticum TaxID=662367 RepID=A0A1I2GHD2_9BACT|nr:TonB-dependent receptor [Spirosoma endophyticum]SFF17254.1 TonB-linked outer membrane protein, SusC/RagA family [Spirosoma endophyticum]
MKKHRLLDVRWRTLMQISCLQLIFVALLSVMAQATPGSGQGVLNRKISVQSTGQDIRTILTLIEEQANVKFLYSSNLIGADRKVSYTVQRERLETVLNTILKPLQISYEVSGRQIILNRLSTSLILASLPLSLVKPTEPIDRTVTGLVTDQANGEALPGVSVVVKNSTRGTTTDGEGRYRLALPENEAALLVFSFVGYQSQEVEIGNRSVIDMALTVSDKTLNEVVVVGYGVQKKVNLTGAISIVDIKKQENAPVTNASQLLQGVEGVYVNQPGGQPGRDVATIRIRGVGTLNNNNPLVLVNGIEFPLENINPADVESISVLKDAASASIYGSRAANGVVLITTKGGKKDKFTVDYNYYTGNQYVNYLPDFVKDPIQFMQLRNQAQRNEGKPTVDYSDALIEEYKQGLLKDSNIYPNNDWLNIMFNPGNIQNHDIRFSAGSDKLTYALSLNYLTQTGVLRGTDSKRYALNYNTVATVNERLKIGAFINASYRDINEPVAGVANLMEMTFKAQAFYPTYLPDGRYANTFIRTPGHNVFRNPLALADEGKNNSTLQQILLNIFAEYKLPLNITYKLNGALNKADNLTNQFVPEVYTYQVKTGEAQLIPYDGQGNRGTRQTNSGALNTTLFNTLTWEGTIQKKHNLKLLAGYSLESFTNRNFFARNEGYLGNTLQELNAGSSNPAVGGTSSESRLQSFFGRLNYNFNERYLAEVNFRYDGSSRFAQGHQWGFFPSISLGWRINEENFMKNVAWVDELKLRASSGQLGNQNIDLFRYVNLVALGRDYPFGSTISSGAAVTAYNDPTITWETTTISNIGIDASLLQNKVTFTAEFFKKRTTNILSTVPIAGQIGALAGPIQNIGTVDNTGLEISAGFRHKINSFTINVSGGFTYVKNKVVDLKGSVIYSGRNIIKEGSPINSYFLINSIGIFQNQEEIKNSPFQNLNTKPGYLKYQDVNGDNVISESDRVIQGSNIPTLTYQFNVNLSYKRLSFSTFFQGVGKVFTYTENIGAMPFWFGTSVTKEWVTDAWTPQNTTAQLPIVTTFEGSQTENYRNSNFWLKNAAYLRMKNIQLSYDLPEKWVGKIGGKKAKLFINGQNLLTFTPLKGFDPEKNLNGTNFYEFPTVKTFTTGINVTF